MRLARLISSGMAVRIWSIMFRMSASLTMIWLNNGILRLPAIRFSRRSTRYNMSTPLLRSHGTYLFCQSRRQMVFDALQAELFSQRTHDRAGKHVLDIASQARNFLDQGRTDK